MKLPVVVQARLGSTRLPGKIMRPLLGRPMVWYVIRSLQAAHSTARVVLAVPPDTEQAVRGVAEELDCALVVGSEQDVLARYVAAAEAFPALHLVRATADNPLVCAELLDRIVALHLDQDADLSHFLGIPLGCGVEVIRRSALLTAAEEAGLPAEREHVTPFLYAKRARFRILEPDLQSHPEIRLTVDTEEDLQRVERVLAAAGGGIPLPLEKILALFRSEPHLFD